MQSIRRSAVAIAVLTLVAGATVPALAQRAPAGQQDQAPPQLDAVRGELLVVDPDAMTLSVLDSQDMLWEFSFTEDTDVAGSSEGIAGLATQAGVTVTVEYTREGDTYMAQRVQVEPEA